mmetsp:Transcript_3668/g.7021  ORF Transcript_3668/g.7021 Transcript_3668/m.7021 type:complete len:225 (+) Transcript_3668:1421-2095(+)
MTENPSSPQPYEEFLSDEFDPEALLRDGPTPATLAHTWYRSAPLLERVSLCQSVLTKPFRPLRRETMRPREPQTMPSVLSVTPVTEDAIQQLPKTQQKAHKRPEHVLDMIANAAVRSSQAGGGGHLCTRLRQVMQHRGWVSVRLRKTHELYQDVQGRLVAFDKHFNLILSNSRTYALPFASPNRIVDTRATPMRVTFEDNGQVLIRGEHIVFVQVLLKCGEHNF